MLRRKTDPEVVPRAGTWIETKTGRSMWSWEESFPVRERGLKRLLDRHNRKIAESFPVRERGLKPLQALRS